MSMRNMLPVILLFFYHIVDARDGIKKSNLTNQIHQSLLQVNAFLEDVQHKIHDGRSALRSFDYDAELPQGQDFLDYSVSDMMWWDESPTTVQVTPETTFLPSPAFQNNYITPSEASETVAYTVTVRSTYTPPMDPVTTRPIPDDLTPEYTFPSLSPEEEAKLTTAENSWRPPGPGQDNGPGPEPKPQYPADVLSTLTTTESTTTVSTTPDPRPPGPGHNLGPEDHGDIHIDTATPESPRYPISAELTVIPFEKNPPDENPNKFPSTMQPTITDETETKTPYPEDLTATEPEEIPSYPTTDTHDTENPDNNVTDITFTDVTVPETTDTPHDETDTTIEMPRVPSSNPDIVTVTDTTLFTTLHPNISKQVAAWLHERANFSDINVNAWIYNQPSVYTPMSDRTETPPTPYPDYSETIPVHPHLFDIFNRSKLPQFTPKTTPIHRQGEERITGSPDYDVPTATGIQEVMIQEDKFGLPILGTPPPGVETMRTTLIEGRPANIPEGIVMDWDVSTLAGAVLHGDVTTAEPRDSEENYLYREMDRQGVGYLSMFLQRITHMVATRKPEEIQPVLQHAEPILLKYFETAQLAFMGQPLIKVVMNIAIAISNGEVDSLQSYSSMMYYMILNRNETASADINSIVDYADSLIEDKDGDHLFTMLKEFEVFPNITKPPQQLAEDLILAFLNPYRRLKNSENRQRLMDSINNALETRFPRLHGAEDFRRFQEVPTDKSSAEETPTPLRVPNQNIKGRRSNTNINQRKRVRGSRNHSHDDNYVRQHKRSRVINKLNRDRHSDFNYERLLRRNLYNPNSLELNKEIESITLSTNIQKRFNVITSDKAYSTIKPTYFRTSRTWGLQSYVQLQTRPTQDYKLNFKKIRNHKWAKNFQEAPPHGRRDIKLNKFQRKKHKQKTTITTRDVEKRKDYERTHLKRRFKTKVLRNIVEGSSYSDEEEALKLNLISAMIHGNRTFEIKDVTNETVWRRAESTELMRASMRKLVEDLDAQRDRDNANHL